LSAHYFSIQRTIRLINISLIVLCFSCSREKEDLSSHIPSDATAIGIADGAGISREIISDYILNLDFLKSDSSGGKFRNTGININADIYFYSPRNDCGVLIIPLNDAAKFKDYLKDSLFRANPEITEADGYEFAEFNEHNLAAGWQKDFAILSYSVSQSSSPTAELERAMKLKKENSILSDTTFTSFKKKSATFKIWWKTEMIGNNNDPLSALITRNFSRIESFINFENEKIILDQEYFLTEETRQKLSTAPFKFIPDNIPSLSDSTIGYMTLNYEGSYLDSFLDKSLIKKTNDLLQSINFSHKDIQKLLSGTVTINYSGLMKRSSEVITYKYDDNFNRVEVKTMSNETFPEFNLILQNNRGSDSVINALIQKKILVKEEKRYMSQLFLGNRFYVNRNENYFLISSNPILSDSNLNSLTRTSKDPVEIFLNIEKLMMDSAMYALPDKYAALSRLGKTINIGISPPMNGTIKAKTELNLKSANKHPLLQILKNLPSETVNTPTPNL
jgi:hypothetical protein